MKNIWNTIKNVLVWLFVALAVCMTVFTVISITTLGRADRDIFGYRGFIVLSDSMSATDFASGDVIFVKEVDPTTLKEGDIIAYTSQNEGSYGETVTHKIRSLVTDENGNAGFITYGTTTGADDAATVTYPYVIGKYCGRIPGVGNFFVFLKTTKGYVCCILIPFLAVILYQAIHCILLFKRYRREQQAELRKRKKQLQKEREETERIRAELEALKAQLAANVNGVGAKEKIDVNSGS